MTRDELPEGWTEAPFGAVTVDPVQRVPASTEEITYIDIGSVDRDTKTITQPQTMLGKDAPSRARKVIKTGDVLVSTVRPNLNAVALVRQQYDGQFASTGFDVLRSPVLDPRWIYYSVRTPAFVERMTELVQGALYPAVRSFDIRSFVIPLAPLPEQKRIADKLEAVLARVDACRARLDRVPDLLQRFRQSVLAAATSGQLTEDWREKNLNVEHASSRWNVSVEPLESAESPEIPSTWVYRRLDTISERVSVTYVGPTSRFYCDKSNGVLFLRSQNVRPARLDLNGSVYISRKFHELNKKTQLKPGDLLIVRVGANRGDTCVLPPGLGDVNCGNVICARPFPGISDYLNIYFQTPFCQKNLGDLTTGSAQGVINTKVVAGVPIAIPPPPEQHEIVRRVEALFAFADRIEARLTEARAQVERLIPATLSKAFRGDLVPQDPNDEPASQLLERLASKHAVGSISKKHRKS